MSTLTEDQVMRCLESVIDPEVGLNIVDLGLVYGVLLVGEAVEVRMTLTTPGCPMSAYLRQEVHSAVSALEGAGSVTVELVWEPAWSPNRIKPGALEALSAAQDYSNGGQR